MIDFQQPALLEEAEQTVGRGRTGLGGNRSNVAFAEWGLGARDDGIAGAVVLVINWKAIPPAKVSCVSADLPAEFAHEYQAPAT